MKKNPSFFVKNLTWDIGQSVAWAESKCLGPEKTTKGIPVSRERIQPQCKEAVSKSYSRDSVNRQSPRENFSVRDWNLCSVMRKEFDLFQFVGPYVFITMYGWPPNRLFRRLIYAASRQLLLVGRLCAMPARCVAFAKAGDAKCLEKFRLLVS